MLVKSKIFLQYVKKIEEIKPRLSKQHNKMLKIRSEMLKIKKMTKLSSSRKILGKISQEFPESRESRGFWESR